MAGYKTFWAGAGGMQAVPSGSALGASLSPQGPGSQKTTAPRRGAGGGAAGAQRGAGVLDSVSRKLWESPGAQMPGGAGGGGGGVGGGGWGEVGARGG